MDEYAYPPDEDAGHADGNDDDGTRISLLTEYLVLEYSCCLNISYWNIPAD
jgi:hypothetical protein